MRDNHTKTIKRFAQTEINIVLGKNEGYMPSSLGGRLISVGRQLDENSRFDNFNSMSSKA